MIDAFGRFRYIESAVILVLMLLKKNSEQTCV